MRKYQRLIAIGIGLGLLVFILITLLSDVSQIARYAMTFAWGALAVALLLRVSNWVLRFFKWHFYLNLVGVRNISYPDSAAVFISGFTFAASPGKAAEVLKSFILKSLTGAPIARTLPVVAAERLSDGVAVLLLLGIAAANLASGAYWTIIAAGLAVIAVGVVVLQIRPLCLRILHLLSRVPLLARFAHDFELFYESSYQLVLLPNVLIAVGLGTLANALDGVGLFAILVAMGQPPTMTTFFQALVATSLSVITGSLSGSPGGIGASDLTITGTLYYLVKLSPSEAGFVTLLARFVQLWFGVLVGIVIMVLARGRLFSPELEASLESGAQSAPSTLETAETSG